MRNKLPVATVTTCALSAAAIAACSGGGGGTTMGPPPPPPPSALPSPSSTPPPTSTPTPSPSPTGLAATTIYVVDADSANDNSFNGAVYTFNVPTAVNTVAAPTRTIKGASTTLVNPQHIAFNASNGDLYVSIPGQAPSFAGKVVKFTSMQVGNVGPTTTYASSTYSTLAEGIALDSTPNLWIVSQSHFAKFALSDTSLAAPLQDVVGSSINDDYGMAIGPTGLLYVAGSQYVDEFPANAAGSPTPNQITGTNSKIASVLAVAVDSFGRVFAGNNSAFSGQSAPSVTVYPAGQPSGPSSSPAPTLTITPPGLNPRPRGLAIDGQNNLFIADYGDGAILVYKPPYTSLSASIVGLGKPVGITVH